ncbi:MAG: hypothetical protein UW94_C0001G0056 [Parcubacteria group bacterium GW2011_GWA2_45_14]|nr:MAG: hypothetical protein UW94_C0001G0056 [Parcubacteria group bacterium GW2011_GWA2_45_14]
MLWMSVSSPAIALADEVAVDAAGNATGAPEETGAPEDTGAPACTGAGCGQGANQGAGQGVDQGGLSADDLGADEEGTLPEGVADNRQGANQGAAQGVTQGSGSDITGTNSNTGEGSNNDVTAGVASTANTAVNNNINDTTNVDATAKTGGNSQNKNTQADGITTGNASIGVTQVKNDNFTTLGGSSGLNVNGYDGDYNGDLMLEFGAMLGSLTGDGGGSVRAVNDTTGANSDNQVSINTIVDKLTEVQNDGVINNILDLAAISGQNEANKNTSGGSIATGDANIAATLVNLLNTTVINGGLWLTVADIFGNLNGNIVLPEFGALAAAAGFGNLAVDAYSNGTGAESDNRIDVEVTEEQTTDINNDADINTQVRADAITGQNEAMANTGGGSIVTGDGKVTASNISLANTTVEGGNWGLVVVNALNRWLGFMVGEEGQVRALTQDETLREIAAQNSQTGANSDNNIDVSEESYDDTLVNNNAVINNEVTAQAITGQNSANKNTGAGNIQTGDANIEVTAINVANTTVKDGSLFIAVVNVFGDWFGDLLYGGSSLLAATGGQAPTVTVDASNAVTGAESDNEIEVDVNRRQEVSIDNQADINTLLDANIETGGNMANRNTLGGGIETGDGVLALHSRAAANLTGVVMDPVAGLIVNGLNDTTGFESQNKIKVRLNEERLLTINNEANVSTIFGALANTGNNEASQNTIGGSILTGMIDANVGIGNLVNQIMLAAGWEDNDRQIEVQLSNLLTGASSENDNEVEALYNLLAEMANKGVIDNIVDLILNTGGNKTNENTGGGEILTGAGCVDGSISNKVNESQMAGVGGWSIDSSNWADIFNSLGVKASTGDNETNKNTGGEISDERQSGCPEIAKVEEPKEPEEPSQGEDNEEEIAEANGVGGGGGEDTEESNGRVAAVVSDHRGGNGQVKLAGNGLLKRFPVAGETGQAYWLAGHKDNRLWGMFFAASVLLLAVAWHFERKGKAIGLRVLTRLS